jgi:hypothetical protein
MCSKPLATILTAIFIPQKNVAAVEFDPVSWDAIIPQQSHDSRNLDFKIHRADPIDIFAIVQLELQLSHFSPIVKVVRVKRSVAHGNHFGGTFVEQAEGPCDRQNVYREVVTI